MTPSQTFQDHVHELRRRLFWVIGAIGISAGIAYAIRTQVISLLQRPLNAPLFYSSPGGGFNFVLKLSMIIGMFVALPVIIYQLLRFIEPALPIRIKRSTMLKVIGASTFLACAGIAFGYFYMIPQSLRFFGSYSSAEIKPLISADSYLTYVINNLLTFAVAFQIPLVMLFINWIRPIKPGKLLKYQRHVIVGAFGLALILPFTYDPISQFMVAVPIVVLFYLSVILLFIANRGKKQKAFTPIAKVEPSTPTTPISTTPLIATAVPLVPRQRLSLDGMQPVRSSQSKLAPLRPPSTTTSSPQKPKPQSRGFNIDGFIPSMAPH